MLIVLYQKKLYHDNDSTWIAIFLNIIAWILKNGFTLYVDYKRLYIKRFIILFTVNDKMLILYNVHPSL